MTGSAGCGEGGVTGHADHLQSDYVICMGSEHGAGAAGSDDVDCLGFGSNSESVRLGAGSDTGAMELDEHCNAGDGTVLGQGVHYYVDVPNSEESMYVTCKRNMQIDSGFHHHLQESEIGDISRFLALPEIIPARQRRRQQPLLDFTKSKY